MDERHCERELKAWREAIQFFFLTALDCRAAFLAARNDSVFYSLN